MRIALLLASLLALVGCTKERTQIMVGLATDLRARGELDEVVFTAWRIDKTGARVEPPVIIQTWDLSEQLDLKYELPGSIGLYSPDGSEPRTQVLIEGRKNGVVRVTRDAIFSLVREQTLFVRLTLVSKCIDMTGCSGGDVCIEGVCAPRLLDSRRFPKYVPAAPGEIDPQVESIACTGVINYIRSSTGTPMPVSGSGSCGSGSFCQEATCLNRLPEEMPDLGTQTTDWQVMPRASSNTLFGLTGREFETQNQLFAVGPAGVVLRFDNAGQPGEVMGSWATETVPTAADLRAAWAAPNGDVWVVGHDGTVLVRNGSSQWSAPLSPITGRTFTAVTGNADRVLIVGFDAQGPLMLYGSPSVMMLSETRIPLSFAPSGVASLPNGDVVVVGDTVVGHLRNGTWSQLPGPTVGVHAVAIRDDSELVVVGTNGAILVGKLDVNGVPSMLMMEDNPATVNLRALTRLGTTSEMVVVGDDATILHSPGTAAWSRETSPIPQSFNAVWSARSGATYAVTSTGEAVRRLTVLVPPDMPPPVELGQPVLPDMATPNDDLAVDASDMPLVPPPSDLADGSAGDLLVGDMLTPKLNEQVQWMITAPTLTPNGTSTVATDSVSMLQWDITPTAQQDYGTALAACQSVMPDGSGGFRLPTLQEALTLLRPGNSVPIDDSAFTGYTAIAAPFIWTQTTIPGNPMNVYVINSDDGLVDGVGRSKSSAAAIGHRFCVRPINLAPNPMRFTGGAGATDDTITQLEWNTGFSAFQTDVAGAEAACVGVSMRLPTAKELMSILDLTTTPLLDVNLFNIDGGSDPVFWSSDTFTDNNDGIWVDFSTGQMGRASKTTPHWSRCVTEFLIN